MSAKASDLDAARAALSAQLARCAALLERARDGETILALRDLLLDFQFESRALITAAEERLGAFSGDDDPRTIAANAELLVEQVEGMQDAWESRVDLLLNAGVDEARPAATLAEALADPERRALLDDFFAALPADMDQTGLFLEYARRYLLSLIGPPPGRPARGGGRGPGRR